MCLFGKQPNILVSPVTPSKISSTYSDRQLSERILFRAGGRKGNGEEELPKRSGFGIMNSSPTITRSSNFLIDLNWSPQVRILILIKKIFFYFTIITG